MFLIWSNLKYLLLFCDARYCKIFSPCWAFIVTTIIWMLLTEPLKLFTYYYIHHMLEKKGGHAGVGRWTSGTVSIHIHACVLRCSDILNRGTKINHLLLVRFPGKCFACRQTLTAATILPSSLTSCLPQEEVSDQRLFFNGGGGFASFHRCGCRHFALSH